MPIFTGEIKTKLPNVSESIFSKMSRLCAEKGAINLAQGFPDFGPDKALLSLCEYYFKKTNIHQYAPMPGLFSLRETISSLTYQWYSQHYNADTEITIVPGATAGIYAAITALLHEGDEIIIFEPAYDSYTPAIRLQGAKPIYVTLQHPSYKIDWEQVRKLINFKTKAILINTPNNPTGTIFNSEDMRHLEELIKNTDIVLISDEVYEHIVFDGYEHQSVARYPKLAERSIIASSFGKTLHATGWKIGYLLGPEALMKEIRKVYQFMVFSVNSPLQYAITDYLNTYSDKINLTKFYGDKRKLFLEALKPSRFKILAPYATYFALLDYSKISQDKDTVFAEWLIDQHLVGAIPTSVFYKDHLDHKCIRVCFAKSEETLLKAADILCKV